MLSGVFYTSKYCVVGQLFSKKIHSNVVLWAFFDKNKCLKRFNGCWKRGWSTPTKQVPQKRAIFEMYVKKSKARC